MKLNIIMFLLLTLTVLSSRGNDLYSAKQAERYARMALRDKDINLSEQVELSVIKDKKEPIQLYLFKKESEKDFYIVFTQAKGRYEFFDYLIVLSTDLVVQNVKILKYRSEHGGEIASKKWLQQFIGYSKGELKYKSDVSAISGATISAGSITKDIPLVLENIRANLTE